MNTNSLHHLVKSVRKREKKKGRMQKKKGLTSIFLVYGCDSASFFSGRREGRSGGVPPGRKNSVPFGKRENAGKY